MKDHSHLSFDGCLNMYGKHIELCVRDFVELHNHVDEMKDFVSKNKGTKRAIRYLSMLNKYYSAKKYIFKGYLEGCIEDMGLPLDIGYVQKKCLEFAKTGKYYTTQQDKLLERDEEDEPEI
jgi:hypothetical protein